MNIDYRCDALWDDLDFVYSDNEESINRAIAARKELERLVKLGMTLESMNVGNALYKGAHHWTLFIGVGLLDIEDCRYGESAQEALFKFEK